MPGTYNLKLYRGDSYAWRFVLWSDPERTDPVDLTGATVASEIRDKPSGAIVTTLSTAVTVPNIVDVHLAADNWVGLPAKGAWDLEVTFPDGEVRTVVGGTVTVTADITNSGTETQRAALRSA